MSAKHTVYHKKRMVGCLAVIIIMAWGLLLMIGTIKSESWKDGDAPLVETASQEIGNVGGEKYWRWFGFDYHVDWCGCFVSWCAAENGYIEEGRAPMFSYVQDGLNWFKENDKWVEAGTEPEPGDIIFYDWNGNDVADHVGIVSICRFGRVYTIEGNTGRIHNDDHCLRKRYRVGSKYIMGYGRP